MLETYRDVELCYVEVQAHMFDVLDGSSSVN
jgi:hypothetical protein